MKTPIHDVIIIGAGIVGTSLALALAKLQLNIALIDQGELVSKMSDQVDTRVSAINHASIQWFNSFDSWSLIKQLRSSPYDKMTVWDDEGKIEFDAAFTDHAELGFIIENQVMSFALAEKIKQTNNIHFIAHCKPTVLHSMQDGIYLLLDNGQRLFSRLVIGADGAHSWLKQQLGIKTLTNSYQQTALVANVRTEKSHQKTAWQHFLPTGPLAFLPLSDPHQCSIVWSANPDRAAELIEYDESKFSMELTHAFEHKLGKVDLISQRKSFPLVMRHAQNYVAARAALVGDAIHTIHPLAGLGLNLGLADAKALYTLIEAALNAGQDIGNFSLLQNYQRQRRSHNEAVLQSMAAFKKLFSNENSLLHWLRNQGLNTVNQVEPLKRLIMQQADKI